MTITTITIMSIIMDDTLYHLMSWLSPSYPVGAFSHSGGLEWAVEAGWVRDRAATLGWIETLLGHGALWNDAALFTHAHRAAVTDDGDRLRGIAALAAAAHPSAERRLESLAQGAAFRRIACASAAHAGALDALGDDVAYPVAVAALAAGHGIALGPALTAYLHAACANLVSAAQRLVPLGQTDAQIVMTRLREPVAAAVGRAAALPEDEPFRALGGATLLADLASMLHETQYTRLFRT